MKDKELVEVIVSGAWFQSFPWSRLLIDPDTKLPLVPQPYLSGAHSSI